MLPAPKMPIFMHTLLASMSCSTFTEVTNAMALQSRLPLSAAHSYFGIPLLQGTALKPAEKIHIIGIGDDGLDGVTAQARSLIEKADLLLGAESTLVARSRAKASRGWRSAQTCRKPSIASSRAANQAIVILASGDPLFYGVARYLCDKLGKDRFEVMPHVSSMQMAFARVKESWEDAYLTNLASHRLESVLEKVRVAEKVGLFTSDEYPPAAVARALLDSRLDYFAAYVCENLGSPDERVTHGELEDIAADRVFAAQRDDPGPQAGHARPAGRRWPAGGCSATRTSCSCSRVPSTAC